MLRALLKHISYFLPSLGALRSASGTTTTNKEPLKKAKTPQGRFDQPDEKSKDVLQSENMFFQCVLLSTVRKISI